MPCIKIIDSIKIYLYRRDHNPPHFHAIYAEYEELILIQSLETYSGQIPAKQRKKVIKWAKANQSYLMKIWKEFNPGK
ncbi:MAG: DUF4160 domain-containing protein [Bacteroidota bacterium]